MAPDPPGGAPGNSVYWRSGGHQLSDSTTILRFEIADLNRLVTRSAANSDLYADILQRAGRPASWDVLVVSCFAVTDLWTPARLAEQTGFRRYRTARAGHLITAGYELWPTETFVAGIPDPRNEVHYDLVVAAGRGLIPADLTAPTPAARRAARELLRPTFEGLLRTLGPREDLPPPGEARRTMDGEDD